jgi:hypothetical protein
MHTSQCVQTCSCSEQVAFVWLYLEGNQSGTDPVLGQLIECLLHVVYLVGACRGLQARVWQI